MSASRSGPIWLLEGSRVDIGRVRSTLNNTSSIFAISRVISTLNKVTTTSN